MASKPRLRWCFHGSAVVRSYDDAIAWLERVFGASVLEYSDLTDEPLIGRRGGCNWIGDMALELIEPTRPDSGGARFLERFGPGMFGVAFEVDDLEKAAGMLRSSGVRFVGDPGDALPILFTAPKEFDGLHLEWVASDKRDWDPHFGAPVPPIASPPLIPVERVAYFGALAKDPSALVTKLQAVCEIDPLDIESAEDASGPVAAVSLHDAVLLLYRLPEDDAEMEALWGPMLRKARTHLMMLRVADRRRAVGLLAEREGIRALREDPARGETFLHPEDTHGILIGLTDRDLPGDPRDAG